MVRLSFGMASSVAVELGKPGDRLGVWRLDAHLANVPSGQWWRAANALSNQPVLVLLYRDPGDAGAVLLRMAASEGQPWQHPDVAWPLDSGLGHGGRPYVVMPRLEGQPLLDGLMSASLRRRLEWVVQLCELLLVAREQGLSLVELDPSLLWVGPQHQLRLHALAMVRRDAKTQSLGALRGQISHAAQALHSPHAQHGAPGDDGAQAFSVGMLMCLLVNGRLPLNAVNAPGTDGAAAAHDVGDALTPLTQWLTLRTDVRDALQTLLHRAVDADPAKRPPHLAALAEAVDVWLDLSGGIVTSAPVPLSSTSTASAEPDPVNTPDALTGPVTAPTVAALMDSLADAAVKTLNTRPDSAQRPTSLPATKPVAGSGASRALGADIGRGDQASHRRARRTLALVGLALAALALLLWLTRTRWLV